VEVVPAASHEASDPVRLAVLPFENLGAGSEREYLADGFHRGDDRRARTDRSRPLERGRPHLDDGLQAHDESLADIGRELDAAYLIESSVRAEGERLRIMSKLIRARDQVQIWSASYDSERAALLEFQCKLSTAIAEQIRLRLSPDRLTALARRQTRNAEAYDLYLRGRYFWNQLSPPTTRRAVEFYTRATELDPEYALAWSGFWRTPTQRVQSTAMRLRSKCCRAPATPPRMRSAPNPTSPRLKPPWES